MYMETKQAINEALKVFGQNGFSTVTVNSTTALKALARIIAKSPAAKADHKRLLAELKRQSLVHIALQDDAYHFTLTPAGAYRLQQTLINELVIDLPQSWDGKWRIVSFDIPLNNSGQRAVFASRLKSLGMVMLQKSMWVHPAPCFEVVEKLAGHYNLLRYCTLIEATQMDEQSTRRLLKQFDLN